MVIDVVNMMKIFGAIFSFILNFSVHLAFFLNPLDEWIACDSALSVCVYNDKFFLINLFLKDHLGNCGHRISWLGTTGISG